MTSKDLLIAASVPWWLATNLRNIFGIENFVETGTGYGCSSIIASQLFKRVYTIEIDPQIYKEQKSELVQARNVTRLCGESTDLLADILEDIEGRSLFFLDAHYTCSGPKLADSECPLLVELGLILNHSKDDCIIIDDARLFLCPPPEPHDKEDWPSIDAIVSKVRRKNKQAVIDVVCDSIVITPKPIFWKL